MKIRVELLIYRQKEVFYFKNIVLPTHLDSSPPIKQTLRWFLQTFATRFIELSSRDRRVIGR